MRPAGTRHRLVPEVPHSADRIRLLHLLDGIRPGDDLEREQVDIARAWVAGGADLYRRGSADVPPMHLVVYGVLRRPDPARILLGAHRKAGLWLPPGGHVEPGEDPADTVRRECREELGLTVRTCPPAAAEPAFLTVTRTRGPVSPHTDVSLWYLLDAGDDPVIRYDRREFDDVRWFEVAALRASGPGRSGVAGPAQDGREPQLGRFLAKLDRLPALPV